jgi:hypothetical protein
VNKHILLAVFLSSSLQGCASITGTSGQSVSLMTREQNGKEISGVACELTNNKGAWFVTTPGSAPIHRSNDDLQVICKKEGMEPGRAAVVSNTKGSMFGNILLGGGIGAIVDHNNGSAYEYPNLIQIVMGTFTKINAPKKDEPTNPNPMSGGLNSSPSATTPALTRTTTQKLQELKKLSDQGLITAEVYADKQKKLLEVD